MVFLCLWCIFIPVSDLLQQQRQLGRYTCAGLVSSSGSLSCYLPTPGPLSLSSPVTVGSGYVCVCERKRERLVVYLSTTEIRERELQCNGRNRYEMVKFRQPILCLLRGYVLV